MSDEYARSLPPPGRSIVIEAICKPSAWVGAAWEGAGCAGIGCGSVPPQAVRKPDVANAVRTMPAHSLPFSGLTRASLGN